jgi:hypothetical protein
MSKMITIAVLYLIVATPTLYDSNAAVALVEDENQTVEHLLLELGKKNDVTFTIEEAILQDGEIGRILNSRISAITPAMTLNEGLLYIAARVPDFTWGIDNNNSKILHIFDRQLLQLKAYSLDRVIDEIHFTGKVCHLVDAIAAKGIAVSAAGPSDSIEIMGMECITDVEVKASKLKVRDALSDFVTLEGRGRILWTARTRIDGSDPTTYVRFFGPPHKTSNTMKQYDKANAN